MEKIFWVSCPECDMAFYANYRELRHAGVALLCPRCHIRFQPEQAAWLDERTEEGAS
jgi:uncharacterized paraquat-inducible protein A